MAAAAAAAAAVAAATMLNRTENALHRDVLAKTEEIIQDQVKAETSRWQVNHGVGLRWSVGWLAGWLTGCCLLLLVADCLLLLAACC